MGVSVLDDRKLEASGLPVAGGAQVAIDATLVSPLKRNGTARPRAHREDGAALKDAAKLKEKTYPELLAAHRCTLVTAAMEVGGRWNEEAYQLLLQLAKAKAQEASRVLRGSATHSWLRRWTTLLSKAAMDSLASILLYGTAQNTDLWVSPDPPLGSVLAEEAHGEGPEVSRMPIGA